MTAPTIARTKAEDGSPVVQVRGTWNLEAIGPHLGPLRSQLSSGARARALWDLTGIESLDSASATVLWQTWGSQRPTHLLARPEHEALLERVGEAAALPDPPRPSRGMLHALASFGAGSVGAVSHVTGLVALLGRLLLDVASLVGRPGAFPWRELSANVHRTGALALPITALVGSLIGVVVSYLSAQQLRTFGADILIIDLLGIAILRELGPLLAAIIVAGRSGSSMTAQIGVMRVTQELDALSVMGISHSTRLVLPKVVALGLALPLLALWTDAMALAGGIACASAELGIGWRLFLSKLPNVVPVANFWLGLGKATVFGVLIALIACYFGLRIEPNTESLGENTTRSVVAAITTVIVVDAVFAVAFSRVGMP